MSLESSSFFHRLFSVVSASADILWRKMRKRRTEVIAVEHLTKRYGNVTAVDDLSFEIGDGHVYGFLGPNGAGKSTTMNIMTGCLSATEGHVKIDGYDIFEEPDKAKRLIGYLPEQPPLYMNETPAEYLRFVGEAKGLRGAELYKQIGEVLEKTKLTAMRNRRISALSKGYKQRVGIAQALLGDPRVIILDEPTVGLDPLQIIEIRDLIRELGKEHTVIFSSHILSEVQTICEKVLIISRGKLVAFDEPENLEKSLTAPGEITLTAEAEPEEVEALLEETGAVSGMDVKKEENGYARAVLRTSEEDIYAVSRSIFLKFAESGKVLLELGLKKADLEDIFIELTENGDREVPSDGEAEAENGQKTESGRETDSREEDSEEKGGNEP